MAPRRALVDRAIYGEFVAALAPLVAGARPRRLIDEQGAQRVHDLAGEACVRGGRSITGVLERREGDRVAPIAIVDCPDDAPLIEGDHFGPALGVVPVDSVEHALAIHGRCDQHLATSVFTRSRGAAHDLASRLTTTTVTINDCLIPTGHPASSISGRSRSGWGESRGIAGLRSMSRPVHLSTTSRLRPSIFEPAPAGRTQFEGMISRFYGRAGARSPSIDSGAGASGRARETITESSQTQGSRPDREPTDASV
jgi:acyl-CoA reductase-like NAD-dependent aldehyde dehydrogenase